MGFMHSRTRPRYWSVFAALFCCGVAAAGPTTSLTITGGVQRPASVTAAALQAQPAVTQTVTYGSGSGTQTHTYVGAALWGTLDSAGIVVNPSTRNDILGKFVVASGSDGYRVVYSLGELSPNFGARPDLLAYGERIGTTVVPLSADGFARSTAPGDLKGGRYVSSLTNLDVRSAMPTQGGVGGGTSTQFSVGGNVRVDKTFDLASLASLTPVTQTVGGVVYTGVSLWNLLTSAVGIPTTPAVKNDLLGKYVIATGSAGYSVVFSMGELDPSFGNQPDFIAYLADGAPLTTSGFARIVVPNDIRQGRWVSNLVSLEVFSVPEPSSLALMLAGMALLAWLGRCRRVLAPSKADAGRVRLRSARRA